MECILYSCTSVQKISHESRWNSLRFSVYLTYNINNIIIIILYFKAIILDRKNCKPINKLTTIVFFCNY